MYDSTFTPLGPTVQVGVQPIQAPCYSTVGVGGNTSYRVSNITASKAYLGWAPRGNKPASINVAAPLLVPSNTQVDGVNVIGIQANSVETFCLPPEAWFAASADSCFEITPGEGM